jgi:hypothetical protein
MLSTTTATIPSQALRAMLDTNSIDLSIFLILAILVEIDNLTLISAAIHLLAIDIHLAIILVTHLLKTIRHAYNSIK